MQSNSYSGKKCMLTDMSGVQLDTSHRYKTLDHMYTRTTCNMMTEDFFTCHLNANSVN